MPHKKKKAFQRNAKRAAEDFYDHAPSGSISAKKRKKTDDDTPKSFLRLVNRKSRKELIAEGKVKPAKEPALKIEPGESLHEFKQRVNKEIPIKMGGMNREPPRKKKKPKPAANNDNEEEESQKKRRRKGKKRRRSVSPDPWAQLAKPIPFNQPAEAPPTLAAPTKKAASSLPKSLTGARKEILEQERQDVITRYRKLMGRN